MDYFQLSDGIVAEYQRWIGDMGVIASITNFGYMFYNTYREKEIEIESRNVVFEIEKNIPTLSDKEPSSFATHLRHLEDMATETKGRANSPIVRDLVSYIKKLPRSTKESVISTMLFYHLRDF